MNKAAFCGWRSTAFNPLHEASNQRRDDDVGMIVTGSDRSRAKVEVESWRGAGEVEAKGARSRGLIYVPSSKPIVKDYRVYKMLKVEEKL